MFIYKITNTINGKIYIGQTRTSVSTRWSQHVSESLSFRSNRPLSKAIRKYGKDKFFVEEIDRADNIGDLNKKEELWIKKERSLINQNGYNCFGGGGVRGEYSLSEDHKNKIKQNSPGKQKCRIVETGEEFDSIVDLVKKIGKGTPSFARNVLAGLKRTFFGYNIEYLDFDLAKKQKERYEKKDRNISERHTGGRRIMIVETGEVFDSVKKLCRHIDVAENNLYKQIKKRKPCKGFTFQFLN